MSAVLLAPDLQEVEYAHADKAKAAAKRWRLKHAHTLPHPLRGRRIAFGGREWLKECGGKIAHFCLDSALQHIAELQAKPRIHNANGVPLTVYLCRWCEWLHVGHSTDELAKEGSLIWSEL